MPTVDHIGISRRIEKDGERRRLREIVDRMRPEGTGFIVRTVAESVEAAKLEADIRFLIQVWNEIIRTKDKVSAPALLHGDLDLILRATRDLFTSEVGKLVIDDRDEYERILRFVREQAPHLESQIESYVGDEPIFDAYGIEQELKRASQRKVWLRSGGYIIMDQAEALTAIDVNSGRYVGKKNLEETITKINAEAAKEIVYQLRLRNIGGIIIIDFIDMDKPQNREKVFKALQDALGRDKAKTNVLKISELGLVEMTRKRVRESVTRMMNEPCATCDGKGHVKSKITIAYEIFREIRREATHYPEPVLVVNCHPEVARILQNAERDELRYLMDRFNKTIQVKPQQNFHQEQFDIYGRQERDPQREGQREPQREGQREPQREGQREPQREGQREPPKNRDRDRDRGRGRDRDRGGRRQDEPAAKPPAAPGPAKEES
jgi:ribonuclease G